MPAATARSLLDIVRLSAEFVGRHGRESPRLDAELLVAHALRMRRIDLYLQFDRALADSEVAAVRELVRRRGAGEPIAYITGVRDFFSRSFAVDPAVLIPRPETETLVESALEVARRRGITRIAELGTGSGCIAVTLARELSDVQVVAVDCSAAALEVAARNARTHAVDARVHLALGSWADALHEPVQMIVSNPPYVTRGELAAVARDVRDHEPQLALDGGDDGLDAYRALLASLPGKLDPGASLLLEVDPRRARHVESMVRDALPGVATRMADDLGRMPRVIVAQAAAA